MARIVRSAPVSWEARIQNIPAAFNSARAQSIMETLPRQTPAIEKLLAAAFGNSDYLSRIVRTEPDILSRILADRPENILSDICKTAADAGQIDDRNMLMKILRQQKKHAALLIALADIGGIWSLEKIMQANTLFADICARATIHHLVRNAKGLKTNSSGGAVLIAMGKYGAGELNYSSDIDVIILYDPQSCINPDDGARIFPELARTFVHILQARTQDGYVFRTDLSLRPDPGTTRAAISLPAAQQYYESVGQNWERAAFIKARAAAGDDDAGRNFLAGMKPFIWRKYLDFAVLEDIHAMKRQAHAAAGGAETENHIQDKHLPGRDIKRAAGGIRDIEMFVQSQQLIAGGRDPLLRRSQTCIMLARLAAKKWITKKAARDLVQAYRFLRHVEHRLQMIADEQTHKLPVSDEDFTHIALFTGFENSQAFRQKIIREMNIVHDHYADLFVDAPSLGAPTGSLIFTGGEDDPETLQSLRDMGFKQPEAITRIVRGWHAGRIPATRSQRARELLTDLIPAFLQALGQTPAPDMAFARFDKFLSGLPMAVQLFALLKSNPPHIHLLALICGSAPRLADILAQNPRMMEAMLGDAPDDLSIDLDNEIARTQNYEDMLDAVRLWAREQKFHIGVRILDNKNSAFSAAHAFSHIAETVIAAMQKQVEKVFADKYGKIKNSAMSILAAGSLGAREMTDLSDLDLIFIYDAEDDQILSDGKKQIPARLYYARLAQMLVQALTVPSAAGSLYHVDMRLRPSGRAGPVAVSLHSFDAYQNHKAWIWEHMALTRMRPITGNETLRLKIQSIIANVLQKKRNPQQIAAEVMNMRQAILQTRAVAPAVPGHQDFSWDISFTPGGLLDAEFICQYLQLIHAADHPSILDTSTLNVFDKITKAGLYDLDDLDDLAPLCEAVVFFKSLVQPLHLSIGRSADKSAIPPSLRAILVRATQTKNFDSTQALLIKHRAQTLACFEKLIAGK